MYYLETGRNTHTRFFNALALALAIHAALILTIAFSASTPVAYSTPQLKVTLANRPSALSPQDAIHIAQSNQEGDSYKANINHISPRSKAPFLKHTQRRDRFPSATRVVRAQKSEPTKHPQLELSLKGISSKVDGLSEELSNLQAELDHQTRYYADRPRVRRLDSAAAKKSADAAYLLDWQQRLENVGNRFYPQASVRYGIYGSLRMLVVIRRDGNLEDIKILASSGHALLDKAAIGIVQMAAPYSAFPPELWASVEKLEIIRTWHFRENALSSP
ncbi:MAG: energy transducer TonB [Halioglobus sp.]|nr:energy transducer TonB [Halioglobus sp.]